ncbi:MAG: methionine--tRNA ligase [Thermoflexales bacterium]|nr:methionine--tRNA ligase [Thermoflexales bacterium]
MSETILVAVAWPYANGPLHLGHIAGAYLPADIFARYQRLKGARVLMVSGSDSHGTPITVTAEEEGVSPREVFERNHAGFLDMWQQLGITFDLFTHTDTENHHKVSQDIFLALRERGYLSTQTQRQWYSEKSSRFLPDRYLEGTCPKCGYTRARGDQCDQCGSLLDALELIDPRSRMDDSRPVIRETEHFFLDLPAFSKRLIDWLGTRGHWRPNVMNFVLNYIKGGLQPRPITRDLDWGIPLPLEGYEGKCLYVWFEAVIGYFSAAIEWARNNGTPEAWKDWWYAPDARTYYFVGKDNIPFHGLIWPAQLMGIERLYEGDESKTLVLPYDVPANEFLNLEGDKFSKSRNWAVWMPDYLQRYDADPLRYYLTINAPEQRDTEFKWDDFVRRNNDELVATWGNLVNRTLSLTNKHFEGAIPSPGLMDQADVELLAKVDVSFRPVGELLGACRFKQALGEIMGLARDVNKYLDEQAPWFQIKTDRARTATTLYIALRAIDSIKLLLLPFLPFSSQRLHRMLGYSTDLLGKQFVREYAEPERVHLALSYDYSAVESAWRPSQLPVGQKFGPITPLFEKLDEQVAEEERVKLGQVAS